MSRLNTERRRAELAALVSNNEDCGFDLDDFRAEDLTYLLQRRSAAHVFKLLRRADESLQELRRLEALCSPTLMMQHFEKGYVQLRGRDAENRPVVWCRPFEGIIEVKKPFAEPLLYFFWVLLWAFRSRDSEDRGVVVIWDESTRKFLDFNVPLVRELTRILQGFSFRHHPDARTWFVVKTEYSKTMGNIPLKQMNWRGASGIELETRKTKILAKLADSADYPDWFFDGGRPFSLDCSLLGNYDQIINKVGFANLSLRDLYRLNVEKSVNHSHHAAPSKLTELHRSPATRINRDVHATLNNLSWRSNKAAKNFKHETLIAIPEDSDVLDEERSPRSQMMFASG